MSIDRYLPQSLKRGDLAAVIGLISDTHMPERRRALPPNLGDVLGGVDFLLHAGDVGELWVLDQLSAIAPVIAVHGNDETEDAQRELPYQQLITVAGQRILLWHSHFVDWHEEMAFRSGDDLHHKIQRSVDQGRRAGASIVVFGHWHIPLVYDSGDILVVNPGALASGNEFSRMLRNTVGLLFIAHDGTPYATHIDLAAPEMPFVPQIDWEAGFMAAANQFGKSIIAPELAPAIQHLRANFSRQELLMLRPLVAALATPIWEQAKGELTIDAVEEMLVNTTELPPDLHTRLLDAWFAWKNSNHN